MPILESTGILVAKGIVSYALKKGLDTLFNQTHEDCLAKIIDKSIEEYKKKFPIPGSPGKFPFYESQILLEELLKLRLFGDNAYVPDPDTIIAQLGTNANILLPTQRQLTEFVGIFEKNRRADKELKKLEIAENYQEQIFYNSEKLNLIIQLIKQSLQFPKPIPKEITAVSRIPRDKIVGREADLQNLRNSLTQNRETVLVNGMGGIGKTTLAAVYADTFYDEYDHIAWLTIESDLEAAIAANYALLTNLNLQDLSPAEHFQACLNELRTLESEKPLLLIIDNAGANLSAHFKALPKPPHCHLLVTSRERISPFHIIELDFLPEDEAIELFKMHNRKFSDEEIRGIVKQVEYHTLTIEILAKSAKKNRWDLKTVSDALALDADAGIDVFRSDYKKIARIKSYLVSIFKLATENKNEIYLLKQFMYLPNEWIAYDSLGKLLQAEKLDWKGDFASLLEGLFEKGLIQKDETSDSFKMHPVVADAIYPQLQIAYDDISLLVDSISSLLFLDQSKDNPIDKFPFIPFGEAILRRVGRNFKNKLLILKNSLGLKYYHIGEYEKARDLLEQSLQSAKEKFGEKHPIVATVQSNLANVYKVLSDYGRACELLEEALQVDIDILGEEHGNVAVLKSSLALVYKALGDYEKARGLLEEALRADLANFGEKHPNVAVHQSNLALVCEELGDHERARDLLEQAQQSDLYNFGEKHPNVAARQSNLAKVYSDLGEYEKARDLLEHALQSDLENFGETHPNVARDQSNLANVYSDLGEYEKARDLLEHALQSALENFGEKHPTVAVDQSNLALVYKALGEYEKARDLWMRAHKIFLDKFGENHPHTKTVSGFLKNIGDDM